MSISMFDIFYLYDLYIICIFWYENKLKYLKLGLKSFPGNICITVIVKFDKASVQNTPANFSANSIYHFLGKSEVKLFSFLLLIRWLLDLISTILVTPIFGFCCLTWSCVFWVLFCESWLISLGSAF